MIKHYEINLEIIEQVEKPTDWANGLVIVSIPNGDLRIYLDPRPLNKAIKRQHHRLPTAEVIISEMAGAQYFSQLDASSGYWQVRVDDASYDLPTFGTPFGRYRFKRLPCGIHSVSEVFQAKVASLIENLPGYSQDDIIVWGTTKEEHDSRLEQKRSHANLCQRVETQPTQMCNGLCIPHISWPHDVSRWCKARPD